MKLIPSKNKPSQDRVMTPPKLAKAIINHFQPTGTFLEPCYGNGAFFDYYPGTDLKYWCEIEMGCDFFDFHTKVNWIISNPPYSIFRKFLIHSMEVANNIVFLCPINHILGLKARMRDIKEYGFYIRQIMMVDTPKQWPSSGFQYAAILLNKEKGDVKIGKLEYEE
jgi:hypothetical protein